MSMDEHDLIKLAKFCGHESCWVHNRTWQPQHDANQQDEIVEALLCEFQKVTITRWAIDWGREEGRCRVSITDEGAVIAEANAETIGNAVCLAALQVIPRSNSEER